MLFSENRAMKYTFDRQPQVTYLFTAGKTQEEILSITIKTHYQETSICDYHYNEHKLSLNYYEKVISLYHYVIIMRN